MAPGGRKPQRGGVYGIAGGGLQGAAWAVNPDVARIGQDGEVRTAEVLARVAAAGGPAVLHDLAVPAPDGRPRPDPRCRANIDHVVVAGNRVLLIDTKVWAPGRYWTLFGRHRHGCARTGKADGHTMNLARDRVAELLARRGLRAVVVSPVVAVWSSSTRRAVKVSRLRCAGVDTIRAEQLLPAVRRRAGRRPADPAIVAALTPLVGALNRNRAG